MSPDLRKDDAIRLRILPGEWLTGRVEVASTNGRSLVLAMDHELQGVDEFKHCEGLAVVLLASWIDELDCWIDPLSGETLDIQRIEHGSRRSA